jgi:hypothetical protein
MIELDDIIEAIGKVHGNTYVLHRSMTTHPKFKVYKVFSYKIYKIDPSKELILEHTITKNLTAEDITMGRIEADKEYLEVLVKWLNNK